MSAPQGQASARRQASPRALSSPAPRLSHGVGNIQRARLVGAMVELAAQQGIAHVTVAHVVARSGMSRRTFYETFVDLEDCFLASCEDAYAHVARAVARVHDPRAKWVEAIRAGLHALLVALDERPAHARVLVVESLAGGPRIAERRAHAIDGLVAAVARGREQARPREAAALSSITAEGVVGSVLAVVYARLREPNAAPLRKLAPALTGMVVLPYLGAAAAQRELERPPPPRSAAPPESLRPLGRLPMRVTHRTICVLQAIGERPGTSNRQAGLAAGIQDQGQASKLLRRLERIGLIANGQTDGRRGSPNSWTLTGQGAALLRGVGGGEEGAEP